MSGGQGCQCNTKMKSSTESEFLYIAKDSNIRGHFKESGYLQKVVQPNACGWWAEMGMRTVPYPRGLLQGGRSQMLLEEWSTEDSRLPSKKLSICKETEFLEIAMRAFALDHHKVPTILGSLLTY